jgi:hypothetical protein
MSFLHTVIFCFMSSCSVSCNFRNVWYDVWKINLT